MKTTSRFIILTLKLTVFSQFALSSQETRTATLATLVETRSINAENGPSPCGFENSSLVATLSISKAESESVKGYCKVRILEAVGDDGVDLNRITPIAVREREQFVEINRALYCPKPEYWLSSFPVKVVLALPSRRAVRIARFRGDFELAIWKSIEEVAIGDLTTPRLVSEPVLERAHIKIKIIGLENHDSKRLLIQYIGEGSDLTNLRHPRIVNKDGNAVDRGNNDVRTTDAEPNERSVYTFGRQGMNSRVFRFVLNEDLNSSHRLTAGVASGVSAETVTFQFENVLLP
jgi:hypothetical protein